MKPKFGLGLFKQHASVSLCILRISSTLSAAYWSVSLHWQQLAGRSLTGSLSFISNEKIKYEYYSETIRYEDYNERIRYENHTETIRYEYVNKLNPALIG